MEGKKLYLHTLPIYPGGMGKLTCEEDFAIVANTYTTWSFEDPNSGYKIGHRYEFGVTQVLDGARRGLPGAVPGGLLGLPFFSPNYMQRGGKSVIYFSVAINVMADKQNFCSLIVATYSPVAPTYTSVLYYEE